MNWQAVINSLTETMRGAELAAKSTDDPSRKLEAQIVSGVAASLAVAFEQGINTNNSEKS